MERALHITSKMEEFRTLFRARSRRNARDHGDDGVFEERGRRVPMPGTPGSTIRKTAYGSYFPFSPKRPAVL